jgi:hypothetical protein
MATLPKFDPIDFLVHRKFPHPHQRYQFRTRGVRGVPLSPRALPGDKWSRAREQYRIELGSLPPQELQALVDLENEKVNAEWQAKFEEEVKTTLFQSALRRSRFRLLGPLGPLDIGRGAGALLRQGAGGG